MKTLAVIGAFVAGLAAGAALRAPLDAAASPASAIIDAQGDRATALSKWTFVRVVGNKPSIALAGRYEDELVRQNGRWRFLRRVAPAISPPPAP